MNTKTLTQHTVGFYATSARLAHAYRIAARHNRNLTRFAEMRELGIDTAVHDTAGLDMVMLSHADDGHFVPTNEQAKAVVSKAFHLLFTEPATHPDQVVQWIRAANIRSENRLYVARVDGLENPQVSQLLGRICLALGRDGDRPSIIDAYLAGDSLFVRGPKHRMLQVPVNSIHALSGRSHDLLRNFVIDADGSFVYWLDLDVHLGWHQFLQAVEPEELRKARQRTEGYNKRYGAAIRKLREEAGLSQSKIQKLTERQLRRIELGECRATRTALASLAEAHNLDPNSYMERLATAMK